MPAESELRISGLSLEQFAGVTAAIAEGIDAGLVFDQEQIDPGAWPAAESGWREAIADSPELHIQYLRKRREAEDCLRRAITPLDEDPSAWLGLRAALTTADDPAALLQPMGITLADVGRLGRSWNRRAGANPALAAKLQELAEDAAPPAAVRAEPLVLRPFPWTPKRDDEESRSGESKEHGVPSAGVMPVVQVQRATFQMDPEPQPAAAEVDPDQTAALGLVVPRSLPFQRRAAAPPLANAIQEQSGQTVGVDVGASPLLLQGYVDLTARLRVGAEDVDALMTEYGLPSGEERRSLHQLWQERFHADAGLRARFGALVEARMQAIKAEGAPRPNVAVPAGGSLDPDETVLLGGFSPRPSIPFDRAAPVVVPPPAPLRDDEDEAGKTFAAPVAAGDSAQTSNTLDATSASPGQKPKPR